MRQSACVPERVLLTDPCPHHCPLNFKHTEPEFGEIEAYAKRHLRVAPVVGTAIRLSLEESSDTRSVTSSLRQIVEGAPLDMDALRQLLPSLGSTTWIFFSSVDAGHYELTTIVDDIRVKLCMDVEHDLTEIEAEGKLRGTAARLIVGSNTAADSRATAVRPFRQRFTTRH
jgi:hypothetical protein